MFKQKSKSPTVDELFDAILTLKTREECYQFFEDIATVAEVKALAQRLQVAKLLSEEHTYDSIAKQTGVSATTICRIKSCLLYGADGYRLVLSRLAEQAAEETAKEA